MFNKQVEDPLKAISDDMRFLKQLRVRVTWAEISMRRDTVDHDHCYHDKNDIEVSFEIRGEVLAPSIVEVAASVIVDKEQIRDGMNEPATEREKAIHESIAKHCEWKNKPEVYWGYGYFGRVMIKDGFNLELLCTKKEIPFIQSMLVNGIGRKDAYVLLICRITHPDHTDELRHTKNSYFEKDMWKEMPFCISGWSLSLSSPTPD